MPATLAHVLAVQGVLRTMLAMQLRSGMVTRDDAADMLKARAVEMREGTDPAWQRAAH